MKRQATLLDKIIIVICMMVVIGALGMISLILYNVHIGNPVHCFDLPSYTESVSYDANGLNVYTSGGEVDHRAAKKVIKALRKLGNIATEQAEAGVELVPINEIDQVRNPNSTYSGNPDDYKTAAYFTSGTNHIVVADYRNADHNVLHEFGHYVDFNFEDTSYDKISDSKIWRTAVEEEYPRTGWDKYYSRSSEFFAECFATYYEDPGWLVETCPTAYSVIDYAVSSYNG